MSSVTTVNLLTKKKGKYLTKYSPPHEHNYLSSIVIVSKLKVENVLNPPTTNKQLKQFLSAQVHHNLTTPSAVNQ